jgi:hypothetical protein
MFGRPQPDRPEDQWKRHLDHFAREHQQQLAALAWGLFLEQGESDQILGIDCQPTPHFVYCPKTAVEELNRRVQNQIQEILGIIDGHQPDKEVLIIGIGNDQIKLIQFEPDPPPPVCFEQVSQTVDTLLEQLEQRLKERKGE